MNVGQLLERLFERRIQQVETEIDFVLGRRQWRGNTHHSPSDAPVRTYRRRPRAGLASASRSVNVPPTSTPICHAIRYSSPSCCASQSLTRISARGPAAPAAALLSD